MTKHSRITSTGFSLAALALAIASSGSAIAATATANSTSTIILPINILKTVDLAFGSFAPSAVGGSVIVTPGSARNVAGGVTAISSSTSSAAQFNVTGQTGLTYSISVSGTSLSNGTDSMEFNPISDLSASAIVTGSVSAGTLTGGAQTIYVGGELTIDANQAPGDYEGDVTALVEYN